MTEHAPQPWKVHVPIDSSDHVVTALTSYATAVERDDPTAAALLRLGATEIRVWRDYVTTLVRVTEHLDGDEGGETS